MHCEVCGKEKRGITTSKKCVDCLKDVNNKKGFAITKDDDTSYCKYHCEFSDKMKNECKQWKIKRCYNHPEERCGFWQVVYGK